MRRVRARGLAIAAVAAPALWVLVAAPIAGSGEVSLGGSASARIDGTAESSLGASIDSAGDFDGDGRDDLIVGAPNGEVPLAGDDDGRGGAAYILYGGAQLPESGQLGSDTRAISRIIGAGPSFNGTAGESVAGIGDVNGDGFDDVALTDRSICCIKRPIDGTRDIASVQGSAFVIYGGDRRDVDLGRLGARGYEIAGIEDGVVGGAGDVNGDGLADFAVGADEQTDGGAYVVFGARRAKSFSAFEGIAKRGFLVLPKPGDLAPGPLTGIGDFNADGLDDIAYGVPASLGRPERPTDREPIGPGAVYVLLGTRSHRTLDLAKPRGRAVRIELSTPFSFYTGLSVDGLGDTNADGAADLAFGAPYKLTVRDREIVSIRGSAFVVFGRSGSKPIEVQPGASASGFEIRGAPNMLGFGFTLAAVGALDGAADAIAISTLRESGDFRVPTSQTVAVIDLPETPSMVRVRPKGGPGQALYRGLPDDSTGAALAGAGDLDGDGNGEIAIGAPYSCPLQSDGFRASLGAVYLLESGSPGSSDGSGPPLKTGDRRSNRLTGSGGPDCIYGLAGDDAISGGTGADTLLPGTGDDEAIGGAGRDRIEEVRGDDRLLGRGGGDRIFGGSGIDVVLGGRGWDEIDSESGSDVVLGGPGNDLIAGGPGRDKLRGGPGDDGLSGGEGRDRLFGGPGSDALRTVGGGKRDIARCGPGKDRARIDRSDRAVGCERILFGLRGDSR